MRRLAPYVLSLTLAAAPLSASAQARPQPADDDGAGFLTRTLQDSLSGAGRDVRIRGFEGALSSRATMQEMTISDDQGVWLTLRGVTLDWSRAALLRGRVEVRSLTADELVIERIPPGEDTGPSPEATGFSLPDLPVSVNIGQLRINRATLGEPVLGQPVDASLGGSLSLAGGEGSATVDLNRIDGKQGDISLQAAYTNSTGELALDLSMTEGPGGIAATKLGLPGAPAVVFSVEGAGPLSDFGAELLLATNGEDRLRGTVTIGQDLTDPAAPVRRFSANVGGNVAPLFVPRYQDFFGPEIRLVTSGAALADGRVTIDDFRLQAREINLTGTAQIGADGLPDRFTVNGRVAAPDNAPVLLPVPGVELSVDSMVLTAVYDQDRAANWTAAFSIDELARGDLRLGRALLRGDGRIDATGGLRQVDATLQLTAERIRHADPALSGAIGDRLDGSAVIDWRDGQPVTLSDLALRGVGIALDAGGTLEPTDTGIAVAGGARLSASDLSRFALLAGRPLSGQAEARLDGTGDVLAGTFDVALSGSGTDLALGLPEADPYLAGPTRFDIAARRTPAGTFLDRLRLSGNGVSAEGTGRIRSAPGRGSPPIAVVDARLSVDDIAPLSSLAGRPLSGSLSLDGRAIAQTDGESFDATLSARGAGLSLGLPEADPALAGLTSLALRASRNGETVRVATLAFLGTGAALDLAGDVTLPQGGASPGFDGRVTARLDDIAPLSSLAGQPLSGGISLTADGAARADLSVVDITADVTGRALSVAGQDIGDATLRAAAKRDGDTVGIETLTLRAPGIEADVTGDVALSAGGGPAGFDGSVTARIDDIAPLSPFAGRALSGGLAVAARGQAREDLSVLDITADVTGRALSVAGQAIGDATLRAAAKRDGDTVGIETLTLRAPGVEADVTGDLTLAGDAAASFAGSARASIADLSRLSGLVGQRLAGSLSASAEGSAASDLSAFDFAVTAQGRGLVTGIAEVDTVIGGRVDLDASATREGDSLRIRTARLDTAHTTASLSGSLNGQSGRITVDTALDDLALLVPGFPGRASLAGAITETPTGYSVDLTGTGPAGVNGRVTGTVPADLARVDLALTGTAPLGLANPFIKPGSIEGTARYILRVAGPPAVKSLSGTLSLAGARLVEPALGLVLEGIGGEVRLAAGVATVGIEGGVRGGGRLRVSGPVTLSPPFQGDLTLALNSVRLADPALYETVLNGSIRMNGPLAGGATIGGDVRVGRTEIRVPSSSFGVSGELIEMAHVAEPAPVRLTRERAGLVAAGETGDEPRAGPVYGLDLTIRAPNEIFVRGRGLDAELGGLLQIGGTTAAVVPQGGFDLIRGRLDILGRRLTLTEGSFRLQGALVPWMRLLAESDTSNATVFVGIEGPVSEPEITFSSQPELPEDEVLAALLFDTDVRNLSAFQAAQLASAVATLAGKGGEGILGKLRRGTGLDDLDVTTGENGGAALRAGKYLSDKVYTDIIVGDGQTQLNLNLDVTRNVTVKGGVSSDGESTLGVFFQRDY